MVISERDDIVWTMRVVMEMEKVKIFGTDFGDPRRTESIFIW